MYQNKIAFTPEEILKKDFKIDMSGYRLKEVDEFLDIVISDYEQFYDIINNLEKEKASLLKEIMSLKQELRKVSTNVEIAKSQGENPEITNVDILRRLSRLEKEVYGRDIT